MSSSNGGASGIFDSGPNPFDDGPSISDIVKGYHADNAVLRQRKFEGRIISEILKGCGLSRREISEIARDTTPDGYALPSTEWFNNGTGFPLMLGCVFPPAKKSLHGILKGFFKGSVDVRKGFLIRNWKETRENYPDSPVIFVTAARELQSDVVIHTLGGETHSGESYLVKEVDGAEYRVQEFQSWLGYFLGDNPDIRDNLLV